MSSIGVRDLTVLGEFKPFGLTAEASDGKPPENEPENYGYFLFDSEVTRERDDLSFFSPDPDFCSDPPPSDSSDHELFIRGNRIIWSVGSRVHKRYTAPNTVLMACWCRMASISSALLCVLQSDTLAIYSASGEVVCIPLPCAIAHVSSLPFGLLLLKSMDGNRPMSSSSSLLNSRDLSRPIKDYGNSQYTSNQLNSFEPTANEDDATICSHLILKHPSEEPQATYFEDRGNMSIMKDFEEKTIWTSDILPLMVSYHKGKMQHSIWLIEIMTNCEAVSSTSVADSIPNENHNGRFSFRRIWQGKCSHSAASKVFLSVDNDGVPVICFLLLEQKLVLAVRLLIDEGNDEVLIDIRPHMTWNIPAISASPVVVTRPRVKIGLLPFTDIIVLGSENCLLLYDM